MPVVSHALTFSLLNINAAPQEAGVYILYEGEELTHIGRALGQGVTIRSRLQDFKVGREGSCAMRATHFRAEVCGNPNLRERELLEEYRRAAGKYPRCNRVSA